VSDLPLVLIDSSAWIEALRTEGHKSVRARVRSLLEEGRACWCDIIALELWHGARGTKERAVLSELQRTLTCYEVGKPIWQEALRLATKARDAGFTVPTADLIISACAFKNKIMLEHCDKHLTILERFR
jgi:predicted nucleic acid-binding protein